jgi:hypothetical protein
MSNQQVPATKLAGSLWPTPTLRLVLDNPKKLNADLTRIILTEEQKIRGRGTPIEVAGLQEGLTTHWLEYNVLNWKYPEIEVFRDFVMHGVHDFISTIGDGNSPEMQIEGISCWANVLRCGESLSIHHHDPAFLSAHYTVHSGEDDTQSCGAIDSGYTIYYRPGFLDRSHGGKASLAPSPWDDDWRIEKRPEEGALFCFPSFIRHEVRPYWGSTYRISIAMDVFVKKQKLPIYFGGPRWFVPKSASS